jgi:gluconate 2-dehydrogenase gamma chain
VPVPASAPPAAASEAYLTLTATEAAFLSAAYDTFIPADRLSPSGTECGLVTYMDRQLAGAWGNGARFSRASRSTATSCR